MLHATHSAMPTFVNRVGVAPATTTMQLPPATRRKAVIAKRPVPNHAAQASGYYMPYGTIEDLRGRGLGIINETDAWLTGRPYGLPGTATVKLTHRANGVNYASQMLGQAVHHDQPYIVGGGLGDDVVATASAAQALTVTALQQIAASQQRLAFWQMLLGIGTVVGVVATVALGTVAYARSR